MSWKYWRKGNFFVLFFTLLPFIFLSFAVGFDGSGSSSVAVVVVVIAFVLVAFDGGSNCDNVIVVVECCSLMYCIGVGYCFIVIVIIIVASHVISAFCILLRRSCL